MTQFQNVWNKISEDIKPKRSMRRIRGATEKEDSTMKAAGKISEEIGGLCLVRSDEKRDHGFITPLLRRWVLSLVWPRNGTEVAAWCQPGFGGSRLRRCCFSLLCTSF